MVIESLKAEITALNEAMKEKGVPEKVMKTLKESAAGLQKLLDKAREAAKEAYAAKQEEEEESGMDGEEEEESKETIDPHQVKPGHKMSKTTTVKHEKMDKPEAEEEGDEPDAKDEKDGKDEDAEESRKVHLELLLKEAGIPKEICSAEKLMKMSLKEAKETIAEKKAMIEVARKSVEGDMETIDLGMGTELQESTGVENLNSLFTGCAQ
jgi:hypothetical protein